MRTLHGSRSTGVLIVGLVTAAALTGCGTAHSTTDTPAPPSPDAAGRQLAGPDAGCGTVTTAAGFPAAEQVVRGDVPCATVTRVFTAYYAALATGQAPGNGGGGPVQVQGWTCTSAPAMAAPRSTCDSGANEITARAITH